MTDSNQETTCLLLLAEGTEPPEPLRRLLDERGWHPRMSHDPVGTMSELCLREKVRRARDAWDLHADDATVVVLVDPDARGLLDDFRHAARKYLAATEVHSYRDGALEAEPKPAPARPSIPRPAPPAAPARLEANGADEDSMRITRREIDMLLEPQPGE